MSEVHVANARVFLEGIEVPCSALSVTWGESSTLSAQIAVPRETREFLGWLHYQPQVEAFIEVDGNSYKVFHGVLNSFSFQSSNQRVSLTITAVSLFSPTILENFKLCMIAPDATIVPKLTAAHLKTTKAWFTEVLSSAMRNAHEAVSTLLSLYGLYGAVSESQVEEEEKESEEDKTITFPNTKWEDMDFCVKPEWRDYSPIENKWIKPKKFERTALLPFWGKLRSKLKEILGPQAIDDLRLTEIVIKEAVQAVVESSTLSGLYSITKPYLQFMGLSLGNVFFKYRGEIGQALVHTYIEWWPADYPVRQITAETFPEGEQRRVPSATAAVAVFSELGTAGITTVLPLDLCREIKGDPKLLKRTFTNWEYWVGPHRSYFFANQQELQNIATWAEDQSTDALARAAAKWLFYQKAIHSPKNVLTITLPLDLSIIPGLPVEFSVFQREMRGIVEQVQHQVASSTARTVVRLRNVRSKKRIEAGDLDFSMSAEEVGQLVDLIQNLQAPKIEWAQQKWRYRQEMREAFKSYQTWLDNIGLATIEQVLYGKFPIIDQEPTWIDGYLESNVAKAEELA